MQTGYIIDCHGSKLPRNDAKTPKSEEFNNPASPKEEVKSKRAIAVKAQISGDLRRRLLESRFCFGYLYSSLHVVDIFNYEYGLRIKLFFLLTIQIVVRFHKIGIH